MCGVLPGRRWKSAIGIVRVAPSGRTVSTVASSTRIATAMSLGCVAMQASLAPTMACWRLKPPSAEQPLPGTPLVARQVGVVEVGAARALQQVAGGGGLVAQLARTRRPAARATARRSRARTRASAARSVLRTSAPIRRPPSGVGSIRFSARSLTSIRCAGVSICSFIRSSRLVPPAMNLAPGYARRGGRRFGGRARPFVGEGLHRFTPATSAIASWMFEYAPQRQMLPLMRSRNSASDGLRAPRQVDGDVARNAGLHLLEHADRRADLARACRSRTGSRRA